MSYHDRHLYQWFYDNELANKIKKRFLQTLQESFFYWKEIISFLGVYLI